MKMWNDSEVKRVAELVDSFDWAEGKKPQYLFGPFLLTADDFLGSMRTKWESPEIESWVI